MEAEGSLGAWFWSWEEEANANRPRIKTMSDIPGQTDVSKKMSKELKKRGWSFVGPTTCYAFMQAMGIVNDHIEGCYCREKVEQARREFVRPGQ